MANLPTDQPKNPSEAKHPAYCAMEERWQTCRDLFDGESAVKKAGVKYLPKLGGQTEGEYLAYVQRAMFFDGFARTVSGLTGTAFATAPTVEAPDEVEAHTADITLSGQTLVSFASRLVSEQLTVGRRGILVDYSGTAKRPHWVGYNAEDIVLWDTMTVKGSEFLTFLVLRETSWVRTGFKVDAVTKYRVLELQLPDGVEGSDLAGITPMLKVALWKEVQGDLGEKKWIEEVQPAPTRLGAPLTFIPFVFAGPFGTESSVEKPPLMGVADVMVSHYRSSADLEHGRHFTALPTPVVSGPMNDNVLRIGSSTAWVLGDAAAKAYFLEFTGQGLASLEKACEEKERLAAVLGSRMLESQKATQEAAATVKMRHAGDDATLQQVVGAAALAMTAALRIHTWWMGFAATPQDSDAVVTLNTEFEVGDIPLDVLTLAVQSGKIAYATYYYNLQRAGFARPGFTADMEREEIKAEFGIDPGAAPVPPQMGDPNAQNGDPNADTNATGGVAGPTPNATGAAA